nr:very low-density lipoprotein receptor-like [Lytechinus pictus]
MEIQNLTVNLTGPLLELVRISAGVGTDPTDFYTTLAYSDGYGYFSSYIVSTNFSLLDNVGYLFIAIPKSVAGTFNINFRVTAVECEYPEELCYGSLHCLDRIQETCDGEVQCLDSGEDEYGCEECFNGQYCFYENKCVQPRGICDNGTYDCASGSDESQCPGCVPCNGTGWCPDDILVCDYWKDCPSGDDEAESLCNHTAFISKNLMF